MTELQTDLPPGFKARTWKEGVTAPADAKRPRCTALESLDGKIGRPVEDDTDLIDWLIVIAYQTENTNGT